MSRQRKGTEHNRTQFLSATLFSIYLLKKQTEFLFYPRGWDGVDCIHLAQDRDHWRALVNTVMNIRIPIAAQLAAS
jgi:hypothetical protein